MAATPAPTTAAPTLKGYDMTGLVPLDNAVNVEKDSNGGITVTRKYSILYSAANAAIPAWGTPDADHATALLSGATIARGSSTEAVVTLKFATPGAGNTGGQSIVAGETRYEIEYGLMQNPIERHPDVSSVPPSILADFQRAKSSRIKSVTNSGYDYTVTLAEYSGTGTSNVVLFFAASTGAGGLFWYFLHGIETYDVNTAIFTKTTAGTSDDWDGLSKVNYLQKPLAALPGVTTDWKKESMKVVRNGNVREKYERWTYNPEGWDTYLYDTTTL
jgi:hypothetical protein